MPRRSNFANSWAKLHKNERNTKGKLVFLYISECQKLRRSQSYEKSL